MGRPTIDYAPGRADSARGTGRVQAAADTVVISIDGGSVDRVDLSGGAKGTYRYRSRVVADSLEQVDYSARRITFRIKDRYITLRGEAQTDYRSLTLKADEIDFDADREALTAEPHPVLIDHSRASSQEVVGQRVSYDLNSSRGTIYHGRTEYESGYIFADSLRKVSDEELNAGSGRYTTCDLVGQDKEPHFHFTSRRMKIYLGDKVVAQAGHPLHRQDPGLRAAVLRLLDPQGAALGPATARFEFGFSNGTGGRFFEQPRLLLGGERLLRLHLSHRLPGETRGLHRRDDRPLRAAGDVERPGRAGVRLRPRPRLESAAAPPQPVARRELPAHGQSRVRRPGVSVACAGSARGSATGSTASSVRPPASPRAGGRPASA